MNPQPTYSLFLPLGAQHCCMRPTDQIRHMVTEGTAEMYCTSPPAYKELAARDMKALPPEDLDSVADEENADPQTYNTRDMGAEPKRRRGRPRKVAAKKAE
jgi:hypothetical protein